MGKIFSDFVCFSESTNFKETFPESVDQKIDCLIHITQNQHIIDARFQGSREISTPEKTNIKFKSHFSIAPEK